MARIGREARHGAGQSGPARSGPTVPAQAAGAGGPTSPRPPRRPRSARGRAPRAGDRAPGARRDLGGTARALLVSLRPRQWPKNAVVLVGLVFAREAGEPAQVARAVAAAFLFCLLSGAVYLANDLPRRPPGPPPPHQAPAPHRLRRPLPHGRRRRRRPARRRGARRRPSGSPPPSGRWPWPTSCCRGPTSAGSRTWCILDVLALAGGFVLRAVAGAVVVERARLPLALRLHPAPGPVPGPGQAPPGAGPAHGRRRGRGPEPTARPWRSTPCPCSTSSSRSSPPPCWWPTCSTPSSPRTSPATGP